ncbi:MAG TPA: hypothetical protein PLX50_08195 [Candidatus Aminicenantes bacterium]|nr:hypothetical protein [Candidatus Aminicenantes bacterium]
MGKRTVLLLFLANGLLLGVSWLMFAVAYPRLPARMPLWINFFGQEPLAAQKSPLLLLYPLAQTALCVLFTLAARKPAGRGSRCSESRFGLDEESEKIFSELKKEFLFLSLIFFNLIFIHIQRTLILIAHGKAGGIDRYYFAVLIAVILMLIPYYRIRAKMVLHEKRRGRTPR